MKKTVSAYVFAAFTLCVAPVLCVQAAAATPAKTATTKAPVVKTSAVSTQTLKPAKTQSAAFKAGQAQSAKAKIVKASSKKSSSSSPYWQCVTFARSLTGMQIFGDAWTWWDKATNTYQAGNAPKPGAVLVFRRQGKMSRGHVAVVSQIITERYIQITHANWSPINGRRGQVEEHVNVMDVSERGDWSKVKVWYGPLNDFGTSTYTTYGFIYQDTVEGRARAQEVIAESEGLPLEPQPYQQIAARKEASALMASAEPAELPAALKAALTPGNDRGFLNVKANTVAAQVTGSDATALVARIDTDKAARPSAPKPETPTTLIRP